jgi:NAD(P)H dehydrogenase (quinone)
MSTNVQIIFYSMYGHVYQLALAVEQGAKGVPNTNVTMHQIKETLPDDVLTKMGALEAKKAWAHVPVADPKQLADADAILLGIPTRFGASAAQVQTFLDATGSLWASGALVGKVGSSFASTATQHGGQETTLVHGHTFFMHQGMIVVGVPYACPELSTMTELSGGTPYGATAIAGTKGERAVSENEKAIARFQGRHVAEIAGRLKKK